MRIEELVDTKVNGLARVAASVIWEDCDLPSSQVHFDTDMQFRNDLYCNPNAFLVSAIIPAMRHGEARVRVDGKICPRLRNGLVTAMQQLKVWYGERHHKPVRIEAGGGFEPSLPREPQRTASFMSGDVDALATLRRNRLDMPITHPASIRDCIFVHGLDLGAVEKLDRNEAHFRTAKASLTELAGLTDFTLIPVYTNVQYLGGIYNLFVKESHGAVIASIAHVFSRRLTKAMIASSEDLFDPRPWGSHPLLDPNYSSTEVTIRHDDLPLSRLQKVALIAEWPAALEHLRVCNDPVGRADVLNCGRCEKCMRTMTALLVCGKLRECRTFPFDDISPELLRTLNSAPPKDDLPLTFLHHGTAAFWREFVAPLRGLGRLDLVEVIEATLAQTDKTCARFEERDWRGVVKRIDRRCFRSAIVKLYRLLKTRHAKVV